MKKLMTALLATGIIGIGSLSYAGGLVEVSDEELEQVYAQGIYINVPALESIDITNQINGDISIGTNIGNIEQVIIDTPQVNLNDSIMLSGNAQQNAFMPINITNSSVNMPINIIIITGDNNGNIDINNVLDAINNSTIPTP